MRKSSLSHTKVFLLQVMRFAKLNKTPPLFKAPPPPLLSPPSKVLEKNKPPGGLIEDLRYLEFEKGTLFCQSYPLNAIIGSTRRVGRERGNIPSCFMPLMCLFSLCCWDVSCINEKKANWSTLFIATLFYLEINKRVLLSCLEDPCLYFIF